MQVTMPRAIDKRYQLARRPGKHKAVLTPIQSCLRAPVIKRIAHRASVKRVSGSAYSQCRKLLDGYLKGIVRDAILYCESGKRKTVSVNDMIHAIRKKGNKVVYSFVDK